MNLEIFELVTLIIWFAVTIFACIYSLNFYILVWLSRKGQKHSLTRVREESLPFVSIHIPTYNEAGVIEETLKACLELNYPREKLEVILIDDSTDETTEILKRYVNENPRFFTLIHRERREGYKAGALQTALKKSKGEYILILDADTVPERDFLIKALTPFYEDEKIAFVQGRLGYKNRNESWITRAVSLIYEWYRVFTQKALSNGRLYVASVGSAVVYRKEALGKVGGWSWNTLTEDLDMSFRLQMNGWKGLYLDEAYCVDEVPRTYRNFRRQFDRHIKGPVQNLRKHLRSLLKRRELGVLGKFEALMVLSSPISFMAGLFSFITGLMFYLVSSPSNIKSLWLSPVGVSFSFIFAASLAAPLVGYYDALRSRDMGEVKSLAILGLIMTDSLLVGTLSIIELLFKRYRWERTEKGALKTEGKGVKMELSFSAETVLRWLISLMSIAVFIVLAGKGLALYSWGFLIPPICWLLAGFLK